MANAQATLIGNITRDPELRYTNSGMSTARFGLAVNYRRQNRQTNEWDETTSFFNVVCFRELAENVSESLGKGSRVIVTGRLEVREYQTQEGEKRQSVDIIADEVGPSLRWATAKVERTARFRRRRRWRRWRSFDLERSVRRRRRRWRRRRRLRRGAVLMPPRKPRPKDATRKIKKRVCIFCKDKTDWVDYKDVNLLRRFMSDRGKIRARRVTGNCAQHRARRGHRDQDGTRARPAALLAAHGHRGPRPHEGWRRPRGSRRS